jgi:hypothetical protein
VRARALATVAAAVLASAVLSACGNDADTSQGKQVADVVRKFALADGPEACDLLGGQALQDNYGGQNYNEGKANCKAKSGTFKGEPVKVTFVKVTSDVTARVNAENKAGRLFVISLSKPEGDWLIERIIPQRKQ